MKNDGNNVDEEMLESTREVIVSLLNKWDIDIPLVPVPYDETLHKLCIKEATCRGYPLEARPDLESFIRCGVVMATTAYAHIPDQNMKILIALWTACFTYVDDKFLQDLGPIYEFQDRFVRGISQEDPILEAFAGITREIPAHLHRVAGNIFVASTLNGVTGVLLEKEMQGLKVPAAAVKYPIYSRIMSIAAEAFAILAFPQSLPLNSYILAMPEVMNYFMNVNDILSFYKEELQGESVNRVSLLASCQKQSKIDILRLIADEAIVSHRNAVELLRDHEGATDAYRCYCQGMINFHPSSGSRYRLDRLRLLS